MKMSGGAVSSNSAKSTTAGGTKFYGPGGGVFVGAGNLTLDGVSIIKNKGSSGGGVDISGGSVKMTGGNIWSNSAVAAFTGKGGGLFTNGGILTINQVFFRDNSVQFQGGGLYLGFGSTTTFLAATVKLNTDPFGPDGVYWQNRATVFGLPDGLIDADDPNGKPVQGP